MNLPECQLVGKSPLPGSIGEFPVKKGERAGIVGKLRKYILSIFGIYHKVFNKANLLLFSIFLKSKAFPICLIGRNFTCKKFRSDNCRSWDIVLKSKCYWSKYFVVFITIFIFWKQFYKIVVYVLLNLRV